MSEHYQKILVPLDGSAIASQALPHAIELAKLAQSRLVVLRVAPNVKEDYQMTTELQIINPGLQEQQATVDHAVQWLQSTVDELKLRGIAAEAAVEVGEAADKIVAHAEANDVDLIIMSTHGRTGLARWAYGSVANKVLTAAPCPVLLVRAQFTVD